MVASVFRLTIQTVGHVHYLPMLAAVMATALVAQRPATFTAIVLSVIADMLILPRQGIANAVVHAALFVAVALVMAEVCHRLASRSALLDSILASVPVVTLNGEGRILRITPAAADLLGVTPDEALSRPFSTFAADFDTTALAAVMDGAPLSLPATGSWLARRPDGEIVPMTIHASLLSPSVDPERMVLSLGDQRQTTAANERMRDLMNQLSKSWRLNSMGEMAATLAHELNQPLTAATVYLHAGQTDIARAGPLGDSAGRALDLAKTQLIRAGDIIRRMREFVSTGARELTDQRVSSMIEDLRPLFDLIRMDTGVVIRVDVRDVGDHVLADRIQFQQAINNLVRNAVDAVAGRDLGLVRITGRSLGNQGYEIVVEDDGPGIPEDQMDRIFQPMTTTKASGMGLGLSVTRSIIESHDAVLTVGRSPLGGAAFSFCLSPVLELEAA
ncbi:MAG: ATP-binding protein [Brevundimonas sp.]|nr:ATP-binding protein [Brevundimonas sp.]MDK2747591.1 ATP-binding protein [Brevundimonas sp.]